MTIRHIGNREDWYLITSDHSEGRIAPWRSMGANLHGPNFLAHAEWSVLGKYGFGVGFQVGRNGCESDIGLNLYAGRLASLWLRLGSRWTKWARVDKDRHPADWFYARHTGLRLFPHDGCILSFEIDTLEGHWSSGQPWWRDWSLNRTKILGRMKTESETTGTGTAVVPLPEGNYSATWKAETVTNRYIGALGKLRDRVLGPRRHSYVSLEIEGGIPCEGKGENSWDCGMDGLFGCSGRTLEEAIGNAVRSTLRDRKAYGGLHNLTRPMTVREAEAR